MNPQLEGIEDIEGTYVFDVRQSVKSLRLNRFFWRHREPEFRALLARDFKAACDELKLSDEERTLVTNQDWLGLIKYGVSFFVLEKFARVVKMSNLAVYASMRGETLEPSSRHGGFRSRHKRHSRRHSGIQQFFQSIHGVHCDGRDAVFLRLVFIILATQYCF